MQFVECVRQPVHGQETHGPCPEPQVGASLIARMRRQPWTRGGGREAVSFLAWREASCYRVQPMVGRFPSQVG